MLHLPTVISLSFILNLIIGLYFVSVYKYRKQTSFLYFGLSCFTFTVAIVLASLRLVISLPIITHYVADLFIISCPLLLAWGVNSLNTQTQLKLKKSVLVFIVIAGLLLATYHSMFGKFITSISVAGAFLYASVIVNKTCFVAKFQQRLLITCLSVHALIMLFQSGLIIAPFIVEMNITTEPQLQIILTIHLILATTAALILPFLVFANAEHNLSTLANHDPLTQLLNSRGFYAIANNLFNKNNSEQSLAVIMLDIDFFKRVNDEFGHDAGDEALKWVSQHLKELFSKTAITARVGGEEFAVLLSHSSLNDAQLAAEKLRKNIKQYPFNYYGNAIYLRVSAGVACSNANTASFKSLLNIADKHLYVAKKTGRDKVIYNSELNPFVHKQTVSI